MWRKAGNATWLLPVLHASISASAGSASEVLTTSTQFSSLRKASSPSALQVWYRTSYDWDLWTHTVTELNTRAGGVSAVSPEVLA
eukprot:3936439-Rhodomonas_salina.4